MSIPFAIHFLRKNIVSAEIKIICSRFAVRTQANRSIFAKQNETRAICPVFFFLKKEEVSFYLWKIYRHCETIVSNDLLCLI